MAKVAAEGPLAAGRGRRAPRQPEKWQRLRRLPKIDLPRALLRRGNLKNGKGCGGSPPSSFTTDCGCRGNLQTGMGCGGSGCTPARQRGPTTATSEIARVAAVPRGREAGVVRKLIKIPRPSCEPTRVAAHGVEGRRPDTAFRTASLRAAARGIVREGRGRLTAQAGGETIP